MFTAVLTALLTAVLAAVLTALTAVMAAVLTAVLTADTLPSLFLAVYRIQSILLPCPFTSIVPWLLLLCAVWLRRLPRRSVPLIFLIVGVPAFCSVHPAHNCTI